MLSLETAWERTRVIRRSSVIPLRLPRKGWPMATTPQDITRTREEDGRDGTARSPADRIVIGAGDQSLEVCRSCNREVRDPDDLESVDPPVCAICYSV